MGDPTVEIKDLSEAIQKASTEFKNALAKQQEHIEKNGKSSDELSNRVNDAEKKFDEVMKGGEAVEKRLTALEVQAKRSGVGQAVAKSIGQQFVESEIYNEIKAAGRGNDAPFFEEKAISGDPASAGALTQEWQNPTIYANPDRPVYVRDLVNRIPVSTDAVKVVREDVFTNNAAPQAGQFATKAESDITFSEQTYPVETIAHWVGASRQILDDANRLRAYIDQRLMYGLDLEMDAQLLFGDGLGNNFTGLMVDAGVTDVGASDPLDGTVWIDHIRSAITACQLNEYYNINGLILNPADWEAIEVAKGSDGHYIWVSVTQGGEMRLWRVPVVVTNAMTQGSFLLGDWTMGSTLYDREQKSVRVSESHADFFVKNAVAILAEERAAFAIELPKAFAKGTLTAPAP